MQLGNGPTYSPRPGRRAGSKREREDKGITKRQNELYSSTDLPALLPGGMLPRQARGTRNYKTYCAVCFLCMHEIVVKQDG